ncbi:unnamed protein product [Timema podura]|uniref:FAD-binding domain-containing protein n=1 Tax=Timema podura TaxID=61482 RepID=A0ABN7PRP9_TIMPD|nr:unnamed protein product [Timema podura]
MDDRSKKIKVLISTGWTAAEKDPNVHFHFHHKLVAADLDTGSTTFHRAGQSEAVSETADLVVGADGAFSTIRRQLMKRPGFDYSQRYIEHGYLELCIPPTEDGEVSHLVRKHDLARSPLEPFSCAHD